MLKTFFCAACAALLFLSAGIIEATEKTSAKSEKATVESPEELVKTFINAMKQVDIKTMAGCCSGKLQQTWTAADEIFQKKTDEEKQAVKNAFKNLVFEIVKTEIREDTATVTVNVSTETRETRETLILKKTDGRWKISELR